MGFVKKVFGGGGPKPYGSKMSGQYEQDIYGGLKKRAGGQENIGARVEPGQASSAYDLSGMKEAEQGFRQPTQFNFQGLPEQYGRLAYQSGAKDIRRENAGQLQRTQESMGTRRPGLLMKAAESSNRNLAETLGNLNSQIRLEEMRKATDLGVQQQQAQAQERLANLAGLQGATQARVGTEAGITEAERAYQDKVLDYLMDLYGKGVQSTQGAAQSANERRGQTLGFLGNLI